MRAALLPVLLLPLLAAIGLAAIVQRLPVAARVGAFGTVLQERQRAEPGGKV